MGKVLICNSEQNELDLIQATLNKKFTLYSTRSWDGKPVDPTGLDAIVLDTNFTASHGFDFLKDICEKSVVPVLFITAPDAPKDAIEARRIGAFNYCVKTDQLYSVLDIAIQEMIFASNDQQELKRTILAQKKRIAELESQLKTGNVDKTVAQPGKAAPPDNQQKRAPILQEIAKRLNSGEINLPAFPNVSIELNKLVENDATMEEIATFLKKDMAISAKLISVANSPRYGGTRKSTTIEQAINVLGLNTAKEFVDIIANRSLYTVRDSKFQAELLALWQHGLACAQASRLIAESIKLPNPGEIFFMGLLHDIGKLLLYQIISELQTKNAIDPNMSKASLNEFILRQHGLFGQKLIEVWKLPAPTAMIAQFHESIDKAPAASQELLVVHLGNLLAKRIGYGIFNAEQDNTEITDSAKTLGLDFAIIEIQEDLKTFMAEVNFD